MPTLPLPPAASIWELIPITSPAASISGPPELPGLIGASVWIAFSIVKPFGALISRCTAETIPAVAVRSRPNGLPIATTGSPTWTPSEEPSSSGVSWSAPCSTWSTAMSVEGSAPMTLASKVSPSSPPSVTVTELEPVDDVGVGDDVASSSITKPEPVAVPPPLPGAGPKGLNWLCCACCSASM